MTALTNTPIALVTGARSGVGFELTRSLLTDGWQVATLTRSALPADPVFALALKEGRLRQYHADLADFSSVRLAAAKILAAENSIDFLFNNAAVNPATFEKSPQGREMSYEVNTVVPYILAQELLPLLSKSKHRKIINVSSNALLMIKKFDAGQLGSGDNFKKLFGAYSTSKLALSLWTKAVAVEFSAEGVSLVSVDPGGTKSPLTAGDGMPWFLKIIAKFAFKPPAVAVAKLRDAAFDSIKYPSGGFVLNGKLKPLPYADTAATVTARLAQIYRDEYLSIQP